MNRSTTAAGPAAGSHSTASGNPRTFGRYAEIPTEQLTTAQKQAYDYIQRERGMFPGPYRI
jgi:hypothetical protein